MHGTKIKLCSFCVCRVVHMDVYDGILAQHLNASFLADFVKGSADVEPRMRVGRKTYVTKYFHLQCVWNPQETLSSLSAYLPSSTLYAWRSNDLPLQ
jgi:hypothetical protein